MEVIAQRAEASKVAMRAMIKESMAGNEDLLKAKAAARAAEQALEVKANREAVRRMDEAEASRVAAIEARKAAIAAKLGRMGDFVAAKAAYDAEVDRRNAEGASPQEQPTHCGASTKIITPPPHLHYRARAQESRA